MCTNPGLSVRRHAPSCMAADGSPHRRALLNVLADVLKQHGLGPPPGGLTERTGNNKGGSAVYRDERSEPFENRTQAAPCKEDSTMKENTNSQVSRCFRRAAIAIVAIGIAAAPSVYAKPNSKKVAGKPASKLILVGPTDLPELARQTGEAMLLHETGDGCTLLYIEQNHGTRLAILDVTDPSHIKGRNSVQLDVPGPFDFVSPLGDRAELVRFRQDQGEAVLDLHKSKAPAIKMVPGLKALGPTESLGNDGFVIADQMNGQSGPSLRDYQVVETAKAQKSDRVFDVRQVREEITNDDTGTTFLLTTDGLYLIRRPAVEEHYKAQLEELNGRG
jgi:hypothetical protein